MTRPDVSDGRSMFERMKAGEPYLADDPRIEAASQRGVEFTDAYNSSAPGDGAGRTRLLRQHLGSVGEEVVIRPPLQVDFGSGIHVGARTFVNVGLVALDVAEIRIGEDVQIGPNVQLLTPTHPLDADLRREKWEGAEPITIGDNVWLGGGVIVCPGVTIGANTVVGAGSVVVKDLPPGVLAVGNPARVVRQLS